MQRRKQRDQLLDNRDFSGKSEAENNAYEEIVDCGLQIINLDGEEVVFLRMVATSVHFNILTE
jgi:hypothetical protein